MKKKRCFVCGQVIYEPLLSEYEERIAQIRKTLRVELERPEDADELLRKEIEKGEERYC